MKVVQPGQTSEDNRQNVPHIDGCSFDIRLDGADAGTYAITFHGQDPTPDKPEVDGEPTIEVPAGAQSVAETYALVAGTGGEPHPQQGFHIKVNVTDAADKVSSKVFWGDCDFDNPKGEEKPGPESSSSSTPQPSVPSTVNSGIDGGNGGLVALGLGGAAVVGLGALGLRRSRS